MRMKVSCSVNTQLLGADVSSFTGYKSSIHTHFNYVIVVSPPSTSPTPRKLAATAAGGDGDVSKVTVFDMDNKMIGYTGMLAEGVREVISEWGNIYILTTNGQVRPFNIPDHCVYPSSSDAAFV